MYISIDLSAKSLLSRIHALELLTGLTPSVRTILNEGNMKKDMVLELRHPTLITFHPLDGFTILGTQK